MQQVLDYSPLRTGVAYLAVAGTAIVWSAVAAQLVTRVGVKPVLVAGMAFLTAGLVYFTQVSVGGSYLGDLLPGLPADRGRAGLLVRADLDRRARGRAARRGRPRVGPDQHVAADRRRARHRRALGDRDVDDRPTTSPAAPRRRSRSPTASRPRSRRRRRRARRRPRRAVRRPRAATSRHRSSRPGPRSSRRRPRLIGGDRTAGPRHVTRRRVLIGVAGRRAGADHRHAGAHAGTGRGCARARLPAPWCSRGHCA